MITYSPDDHNALVALVEIVVLVVVQYRHKMALLRYSPDLYFASIPISLHMIWLKIFHIFCFYLSNNEKNDNIRVGFVQLCLIVYPPMVMYLRIFTSENSLQSKLILD